MTGITAGRTGKREKSEAAMVRPQDVGWGTWWIGRKLAGSSMTVRRLSLRATSPVTGANTVAEGWLRVPWGREWLPRCHADVGVVLQDLKPGHAITVLLGALERAVAPYRAGPSDPRGVAVRHAAGTAVANPIPLAAYIDGPRKGAGVLVRYHAALVVSWVCASVPTCAAAGVIVGPDAAFDHSTPRSKMRYCSTPSGGPLLASVGIFILRPRASYGARTKGQDGSGVKSIYRSGLALYCSESSAGMEAHLPWWLREDAETRCYSSTEERIAAGPERHEPGHKCTVEAR